jgi:hypothetical protein
VVPLVHLTTRASLAYCAHCPAVADYAVEIYHEALKKGKFKCFLRDNTRLPMIYLPDVIKVCWQLALRITQCRSHYPSSRQRS